MNNKRIVGFKLKKRVIEISDKDKILLKQYVRKKLNHTFDKSKCVDEIEAVVRLYRQFLPSNKKG